MSNELQTKEMIKIMKKYLSIIIYSVVLSISINMTVIAMPYNSNAQRMVEAESNLLPKSVRSSSGYDSTKARGNFFAEANVTITNEGNGNIAGSATAYLDVSADEVYITIYLERWDVAGERWRQVTYYDAEFYAKDYQEGLNRPSLNITFKNQDKGYYYRSRGVFVAVYDGKFEGFSPATDGVWVD